MWLCEHIYVPTTRVIQVCPHVAVANNPNLNPETRSEPSHGSLKLCAKVSKCPHKVLNWQWFSQRQPHTRAHIHTHTVTTVQWSQKFNWNHLFPSLSVFFLFIHTASGASVLLLPFIAFTHQQAPGLPAVGWCCSAASWWSSGTLCFRHQVQQTYTTSEFHREHV